MERKVSRFEPKFDTEIIMEWTCLKKVLLKFIAKGMNLEFQNLTISFFKIDPYFAVKAFTSDIEIFCTETSSAMMK